MLYFIIFFFIFLITVIQPVFLHISGRLITRNTISWKQTYLLFGCMLLVALINYVLTYVIHSRLITSPLNFLALILPFIFTIKIYHTTLMRSIGVNLLTTLLVVSIALPLRLFVIGIYSLPTGSNKPTLQEGDVLLGNKIIYHFRDIERGDMISFKYPADPSIVYSKRVIGLPGEKVALRDDTLYINNQRVEEGYVIYDDFSNENFGPYEVPEDSYFLMGDNRDNSADSRYFGPVHRELIISRLSHILYSRDPRSGRIDFSRICKEIE